MKFSDQWAVQLATMIRRQLTTCGAVASIVFLTGCGTTLRLKIIDSTTKSPVSLVRVDVTELTWGLLKQARFSTNSVSLPTSDGVVGLRRHPSKGSMSLRISSPGYSSAEVLVSEYRVFRVFPDGLNVDLAPAGAQDKGSAIYLLELKPD